MNNTGTELEILKGLERAFYKKNPNDPRFTNQSMTWFRNYITKNVKNVRLPRMVEDRSLISPTIKPGQMLLFQYDPLWKEELPFYDAQPLIFPISKWNSSEGKLLMTGINLHLLPPVLRQKALLAILNLQRGKYLDWSVLKKLSEHKLFQHSVRAYRLDHLRSQFIVIPEESWEIVLFLPLQRFKKSDKGTIWKM